MANRLVDSGEDPRKLSQAICKWIISRNREKDYAFFEFFGSGSGKEEVDKGKQ
jgi:hypothetical protein